jgi:hypothetical protein
MTDLYTLLFLFLLDRVGCVDLRSQLDVYFSRIKRISCSSIARYMCDLEEEKERRGGLGTTASASQMIFSLVSIQHLW